MFGPVFISGQRCGQIKYRLIPLARDNLTRVFIACGSVKSKFENFAIGICRILQDSTRLLFENDEYLMEFINSAISIGKSIATLIENSLSRNREGILNVSDSMHQKSTSRPKLTQRLKHARRTNELKRKGISLIVDKILHRDLKVEI